MLSIIEEPGQIEFTGRPICEQHPKESNRKEVRRNGTVQQVAAAGVEAVGHVQRPLATAHGFQ